MTEYEVLMRLAWDELPDAVRAALVAHHRRTITLIVPELTEDVDGIPSGVTRHEWTGAFTLPRAWQAAIEEEQL